MEDIILLGAGGHAKSVIDCIKRQGEYKIIGFLDKEERGKVCYKGYEIIGGDDNLPALYAQGVRNAFVTVGFLGGSTVRNRLYDRLKQIGFRLPNIIDPSAVVAEDAGLGEGNFIGKLAMLNADAKIGSMCIINSGALIEHECRVGDFSHISVGSVLCGGVTVGSNTFVGAGSTLIQGITVGDGCIVAAGMTLRKSIRDHEMVYEMNTRRTRSLE
ncbi:MAG: acetyltransferase [Bacteroidales bacterium]|nr:acetyltransferase [Bacteroidales bacterium]MCM1414546.1 acetyltransferase [bacterium]